MCTLTISLDFMHSGVKATLSVQGLTYAFMVKKKYSFPHVAQAGLGDTKRELVASC